MSRPRKPENINLPANLHPKKNKKNGVTYYFYQIPDTTTSHSLGTDKNLAIEDAIALNKQFNVAKAKKAEAQKAEAMMKSLETSTSSGTLAEVQVSPVVHFPSVIPNPAKYNVVRKRTIVINGKEFNPNTFTLEDAINLHFKECEDRGLAESTWRNKRNAALKIQELLGKDSIFLGIETIDITNVLEAYKDQKKSMFNGLRTSAIDIWRDAKHYGIVKTNEPESVRPRILKTKRSRLSLEDFNKIYQVAIDQPNTWVARAFELALLTAQRREDLSRLEFKPSKISTAWLEDDYVWVIQHKYKCKICIPYDISVNGFVLADTIKACRNNIVSNSLLHYEKQYARCKVGGKVPGQKIAAEFAKCRDLAGVKGEEGKTPPTLHEVRSLAIRLYTDLYGAEFAKMLAGHKKMATTEMYQDTRGQEWIRIRAVKK